MKANLRTLNGYRLLYRPGCVSSMTSANWRGYIYERILVVEKYLGRDIRDNEDVHHLDMDRTNNRIENLIVLEKSQHGRLHA